MMRSVISSLAIGFLLSIGLVGPVSAIDREVAFEDVDMQARYQRVIHNIRCLTCQNQSIKDSNSPLARDLRREVREQMASGASDGEIYAFMQARYGDFALYKPPLSAKTVALWSSPALLMAIALFALFRTLKRRSQLDISIDGD
ncbi:MAG: cytochrome c-type biogenesis protein [Pseudomonadota bacterium]